MKGTPVDKIPHVATWLHQQRWKDDQSHARNRPLTSTEQLDRLATITSTEQLARLFPEPALADGPAQDNTQQPFQLKAIP